VGETSEIYGIYSRQDPAFSILERIDVGETLHARREYADAAGFQYPRTDRRG